MIKAITEMALHGTAVYATLEEPLHLRVRTLLGRLVNAHPDEIALVENTSVGINLIAQSLPLRPGDNVLLCDVEFPSNVYPWMNLSRAKSVETRILPSIDGGLSLETLDQHCDEHSRVVAVSGVQFFTGRREGLAALGRYCQDNGLWLVVDAMQAAGVIPIDMVAMGIHALAAGGQKALCGPPGQGFMAIRAELIEQMTPIFVGPVSVEGWEHWLRYDTTPRQLARRFDMGTANLAGLVGLHAAVNMLLDLGIDHIADWVTHLSSAAISDLIQRGYQVITPADPRYRAHIVTFAWDGDVHAAVSALQKRGIILREHLDRDGNPHLRMSMHCYNTVEEVLQVGEALEEVTHE
jgi:selenocysteine lyase/cysteine desulfurase